MSQLFHPILMPYYMETFVRTFWSLYYSDGRMDRSARTIIACQYNIDYNLDSGAILMHQQREASAKDTLDNRLDSYVETTPSNQPGADSNRCPFIIS